MGLSDANSVVRSLGLQETHKADPVRVYDASSTPQRSQRVNIFAANQYEWAISPSIYLDPSINNLQVEFDAAITDFANTAQGYLGSDDTLAVVISTDNGNTWSDSNILWYVTANDTVDSTGEHIIIPLTAIRVMYVSDFMVVLRSTIRWM